MDILDIESILNVINKLPHSKSRVPYTYHHDYLRLNSVKYRSCSRSDVANTHENTEIELYAVALIKILDELGSDVFNYITENDLIICKIAKKYTNNVINNLLF